MIPKILHFIWIGQKPKYVDFAINAYREINPNCNINLASFSSNHFEEIYFDKKIQNENEQIAYDTLNAIFNNKYEQLLHILLTGQQHINYSTTPFQQVFVDIYRLALVNHYGGIYLDCDTYPIRKFDDAIFKHECFCVQDKVKDGVFALNNYFLGTVKNAYWQNYFDTTADKIIQENNQQFTRIYKDKSIDFMVRRIKFFKCKLSKADFKNINTTDYFEHYSEFRWGTGKMQLTKFDSIFNRAKFLNN